MLIIVKRKYNLYKRNKSSGLDRDYNAYVKQRNETNAKIRQAQKDYEKKLINKFKKEPKKFYGYLRSKQKVQVIVTQLEKKDCCLTENDQEKPNVLGDFFKSVFVHEDKSTIPELYQRSNECVTNITFTEETVRKKLQNIQPDKAPGPDGLHPRVLRV